MIFPQAQKYIQADEKYKVTGDYEKDSLLSFYHRIKDGNEEITVSVNPLLGKEEYILSITPDGIKISASCDEGIYRAATSLFQIIKRQGKELQCAVIEDKPQFERRGYMLDISRCRMPKLSELEKMIDFLSALKYNEFQLYMEGDCFKYSAYPKYTESFDCLSAEDIKELDAYCRERFIDLVPNQNSLGHLAPWLKYDEFKSLGLSDDKDMADTINPLLPESLEFVKNLYSSLLPHFKSEYVNIGLDEAFGLGKFQIEEYCKEHGKDIVFMEWLNKLNNHVKETYGKKVMFWSDMIYKSEKLYDMIPKDSVVLEWGYELIQSQLMTEHCIAFKNAKLNYYVCPSCNTHKSFTGRADVTSFNIRTAAEIGAKYGARGLLMTDWGCGEAHPHFGVWSLVPAALAGQYAWNIGAEQDGESFKADFIRNAENYVDEVVFGGVKVSRLMYRMANYYLLEPERVHVGTMCGELFQFPISQTKYAHLYDLKNCGDAFYFNNVTEYVKKVLADIEKLEFNEQLKREIILNSRMVILSSEICKIRIGEPVTNNEIDELVSLIDWISEEYYTLWCRRNFEKGVEEFMGYLKDRKAELTELRK
ncbi:MAG: family 20 glycosylhydrolase [Oscillospiraceae bacterium]|nr:family 20 glycosylhydrolase [Oscillospiraceae bacterium]